MTAIEIGATLAYAIVGAAIAGVADYLDGNVPYRDVSNAPLVIAWPIATVVFVVVRGLGFVRRRVCRALEARRLPRAKLLRKERR